MIKWIVISTLFLFGCTQESKVKSAAENGARQHFEVMLKKESAPLSATHQILQAVYVRVLSEKIEVEVDNVEITGNSAKVAVSVKSVAVPVRAALRDIIMRLDPGKQDGFNVPDALGMVAGQLGLSETIVTERKVLDLRNDDGWKVVGP